MLQAGKSLADSNVSGGTWTQAKSDAAYQELTSSLNALMNAPLRNPSNTGPNK